MSTAAELAHLFRALKAPAAARALPVLADPIVIGAERYIDGGLREIIPVEIAARAGVTDLVGIAHDRMVLP